MANQEFTWIVLAKQSNNIREKKEWTHATNLMFHSKDAHKNETIYYSVICNYVCREVALSVEEYNRYSSEFEVKVILPNVASSLKYPVT